MRHRSRLVLTALLLAAVVLGVGLLLARTRGHSAQSVAEPQAAVPGGAGAQRAFERFSSRCLVAEPPGECSGEAGVLLGKLDAAQARNAARSSRVETLCARTTASVRCARKDETLLRLQALRGALLGYADQVQGGIPERAPRRAVGHWPRPTGEAADHLDRVDRADGSNLGLQPPGPARLGDREDHAEGTPASGCRHPPRRGLHRDDRGDPRRERGRRRHRRACGQRSDDQRRVDRLHRPRYERAPGRNPGHERLERRLQTCDRGLPDGEQRGLLRQRDTRPAINAAQDPLHRRAHRPDDERDRLRGPPPNRLRSRELRPLPVAVLQLPHQWERARGQSRKFLPR